MTQLAPGDVPESATAGRARGLEDHRHDLPHDAERFSVGLEDDRKLQRAKLIAGVLSELVLIGMLITSLQEPGREATVLLAAVVVGLGMVMGVHLARYRTDGQPRTHS
jgi:hypothetical protein